MTFRDLLNNFKDKDRPEIIREFDEIVSSNEIKNRYEFEIVYRKITEDKKIELVKYAIWSLLKRGKSLKDILKGV